MFGDGKEGEECEKRGQSLSLLLSLLSLFGFVSFLREERNLEMRKNVGRWMSRERSIPL